MSDISSKTRRSRLSAAAALTVVVLALSGCGGKTALGGDPKLNILPSGVLPEPSRGDYAAIDRPYYIGPSDQLTVSVYGVEDLTNIVVVVDSSGSISFPLVGSFNINGKTPLEVERDLSGRLRMAHMRDPIVSVNLKEVASRLVTVEGQVKVPGLYPVIGRMTLMGAVAKAQGTTEFSQLDYVVIYRIVGNQRFAALYDLKAIRHGQYGDPEIFPNDIVMVGDSNSRALFKDLLTVVPALLSPLVILLTRTKTK